MSDRASLSAKQDDLSPAEVVRRLEGIFPWVHVNPLVGRYRVNHLIGRLKQFQAPEVIVRAGGDSATRTVQLAIYEGDPLTEVLDLTVGPYRLVAYHPDGLEEPLHRAAAALDCEITEDPIEEGDFDERGSPEETRLRTGMNETRRAVAEYRDRFEGAEALYVSDSLVSRMRVRHLQLTEPYFAADLELLPTPGLVNERMPTRIVWPWDQFHCCPEHWISGPYAMEILHFRQRVSSCTVRYCESLCDAPYTPALDANRSLPSCAIIDRRHRRRVPPMRIVPAKSRDRAPKGRHESPRAFRAVSDVLPPRWILRRPFVRALLHVCIYLGN